MNKIEAASFLSGVTQTEGAQSSAPTNLHLITGEVIEASADGKVKIDFDGLVFGEDDHYEPTDDDELDPKKLYYTIANSYARTEDEEINTGKTYFVYDVGTSTYTQVLDPRTVEISSYYEIVGSNYVVVQNPVLADIANYYELIYDDQYVEIDALGGLEEGDLATIALSGEQGHAQVPLALGAPGSVDRINELAVIAEEAANSAVEDAAIARDASEEALESASAANNAALEAKGMAQSAAADAAAASASALEAKGMAQSASASAATAQTKADEASAAAIVAQRDADVASAAASAANTSATNALLQLSVVQDVAGVLSWIQEHGSYAITTDVDIVDGKTYFSLMNNYTITEDDAIDASKIYYKYLVTYTQTHDLDIIDGKTYYTYDSSTGTYSAVSEPDISDIASYYEVDSDGYVAVGSPVVADISEYYELTSSEYIPVTTPVVAEIAGYYELSIEKSQADYVMSHLAVTAEGLWVLPGGIGYLASPDTVFVPDKLYYEKVNDEYLLAELPSPALEGWFEYNSTDGYFLSTDQVVNSSKSYYSNDGSVYELVTGLSPVAKGWYEHDPQTGYKALYGSEGHKLYDGSGRLVKTEGESIDFSSTRPQHIGGENAYIMYYDSDNDGLPDSITIGGSNVSIGNKSLTEMLNDISEQQGSVSAIESFLRIVTDGLSPKLILGGVGSSIETRMTNDRFGFYKSESPDDEPITSIYIDTTTGQGILEVTNAVIVSELRLGRWAWTPRKNGNLALKWFSELVDPEEDDDEPIDPVDPDDPEEGGGE